MFFCRPLQLTAEDHLVVCQALDKLIEECTLILGWCFSAQQVKETKDKQRDLSRSALAAMEVACPPDQEEVPDEFAEHYQLSQPLVTAPIQSAAGRNLLSSVILSGLIGLRALF